MAQDPKSLARRRRCRPDRAQMHAELQALTRLEGVWTLRAAVVDAGGERSWDDLLQLFRRGQEELGEGTGADACIRWLTVLYTLHRMEGRGYRGLIGAADAVSRRVAELLGLDRGMSVRTINGASRIMEHVGILDRWVYGRGRLAEAPDPDAPPPPTGEPAKRPYKRPVSAWTLTALAVSFWSAPRRRNRRVVVSTTSANVAENTLLGRSLASLGTSGDAHAIDPVGRGRPEMVKAESLATASDAFSLASGAGSAEEGTRASPVPRRRYSWRPGPDEPNTLGNAAQALLYDAETVLIRHGRRDRGELLAALEAELDPRRMLATEIARAGPARSTGPPRRSSGLEGLLAEWLWHWRELELETRRLVVTRMILPAMLAHLRRVELWRLPQLEREVAPGEIARAHISRARCVQRPPDPGPRMVAERGIAVIASPGPLAVRPRAAPPAETDAEIAEWLEDLKRRRGGEEASDD